MTGSFCVRNEHKNRDRVGAFACAFQTENLDLLLAQLETREAPNAQQRSESVWYRATGECVQLVAYVQARQTAPAPRPSARRPSCCNHAGRIDQTYQEARTTTSTAKLISTREDSHSRIQIPP